MAVKKKQVSLPDKPSKLILVALRDLEAVERSKKYEVVMSQWHTPNYSGEGKCAVCFAGAVMARTLRSDPAVHYMSLEWDRGLDSKLDALDDFRSGNVVGGFRFMELTMPQGVPGKFPVADYGESPDRFKRDMRKLAAQLAKAGA